MPTTTLITGASSGIGAGLARLYGARGERLALCARRADRLDELKAEIDALGAGGDVLVRQLDVTEHERVFEVFRELDAELGGLDRVIVNAGIGKGASVGTGYFTANRQTVEVNAVAALAQCEAAMELFRAAGRGHLVVMSSISSRRGARGAMTAYAASKAFLTALAEGIRSDVAKTPITVTTLLPGFIDSEMTARASRTPFMVDTDTGVRAILAAIDRAGAEETVPAWPWRPIGVAVRLAPRRVVQRFF